MKYLLLISLWGRTEMILLGRGWEKPKICSLFGIQFDLDVGFSSKGLQSLKSSKGQWLLSNAMQHVISPVDPMIMDPLLYLLCYEMSPLVSKVMLSETKCHQIRHSASL